MIESGRTLLCLLILLCGVTTVSAQLNATLKSNLDYPIAVNDVWGYVAPDSTEYAIVGLDDGVSVVSLADPAKPVEVGRTQGANSPWRDMKTYGGFAYVTADRGADGLTVIDLRQLPASISYTNNVYAVPGFDRQFLRAHNIYIDTTTGLAFTAGGDLNVNDGGILIFDLKANPERPPLVAVGPETYSHDVYVRDGLMYASEIYRGELAIYDIHRLDSIVEVGRTRTPFTFTHNAWTSDDATVIFTTDEVENASVAAFAIGDRADIRLLDEYRPLSSLNTRTIPHNVHVIDDYLSISYYTDGLRVVDASDPTNLIEVANYDTWKGPDGGFNGNWGAYPFLPSGLTLVSDRSTGLYVVDVDYKRAARLSGTITDRFTGSAINNAAVRLISQQAAYDVTDASGAYQTGLADAGSYQVVITASGYYPDTLTVRLENGIDLTLDATLQSRQVASARIQVRDRESDLPVGQAQLTLISAEREINARIDSSGAVELPQLVDEDYEVIVSAWGYRAYFGRSSLDQLRGTTIYLHPGYEDYFLSDLGWTVTGTATDGDWALGTPEATSDNRGTGQPGMDAPSDPGGSAYVTGLLGGVNDANDVDGGYTTLRSPPLDLAGSEDSLRLSYHYFFTLLGAFGGGDDGLTLSMTNNRGDSIVLARYTTATQGWTADSLVLTGRLPFTDAMYLYVTATDEGVLDDVVEAGFDAFRLTRIESTVSTGPSNTLAALKVDLFPNPSAGLFTASFPAPSAYAVHLTVYDVQGRIQEQQVLQQGTRNVRFGAQLTAGTYFLRVTDEQGRPLNTRKLIKQ